MNFKCFIHGHDGEMVDWNFTHGMNGNDYSYIIITYKCKRCGKYYSKSLYGTSAQDFLTRLSSIAEGGD